MNATIISFRRGRHTQRTNQFLLELPGVDTRAKATPFIGKKVIWQAPARARDKKPKEIVGKITSCHGNHGVVRARFSRGLPGTAVTTKATVVEKS